MLEHLRLDFDGLTYGATGLICAGLLFAQYGLGWFDPWQTSVPQPWSAWPGFFALHAVPYLLVLGLVSVRGPAPGWGVIPPVLLGLAALTTLDWWPFHRGMVDAMPEGVRPLASSLIWNFRSVLVYLLPVGLYWLWVDRKHGAQYGWSWKRFNFRPFLPVAGLLVVGACLASFTDGFRTYYPSYEPGPSEIWLGVPLWVGFGAHELVYGLQFVGVETFFRGFFVIGVARWLGRGAVLPMVTIYLILHLEKPFVEAFTSIFGGYVLGVWAVRKRCILEGIVLHLSLAWAMDLAAWLQFLVRRDLGLL